MYRTLGLETIDGRRVPTEFVLTAMIYSFIYVMIISQIWGHSIAKPKEVISIPVVTITKSVEMTDAPEVAEGQVSKSQKSSKSSEVPTLPRAGVSKFLTEFPIAKVKTFSEDSGFSQFIAEIPVEKIETSPLSWEEGMAIAEHNFSEEVVKRLAILLEGEGGGLESLTELSGIGWIVVNRTYHSECPNDVIGVITQDGQFDGYTENGYYSERSYWLANDILARYERELAGEENVGRTIPKEYLFFYGDGEHNYFSVKQGGEAYVWGSSLESPYNT